MDTADVIVVGAGLAGLSVAWHLPEELRVTVLDQGRSPASEATAQSSGMVRRMDLDPPDRALARRSFAAFQAPGPDWTRPPSHCTGAVLALERDPTHIHDAVAHLRAGGVRVEDVHNPADLSPALLDSPILRAWYLPDEHTADVSALADGFLRGLQRLGRKVHCHTEVVGLLVDKGPRLIGVQTRAGPLHADAVVLAGGAWCQPLAAGVGLWRPLIPLRRNLAVCKSALQAHGPWVWVDDVGVYVRPENEGWLASPCDETPDRPPPGPGSTGPLAQAQSQLLQTKLARLFPAIGPFEVQRGWSGLRTFAPDRRPMLGADPELTGLWWAAGLGGAGVSSCFGVGEAIATWMAGRETPWLEPSTVCPGRAPLQRWAILPDGDPQNARLISADPA